MSLCILHRLALVKISCCFVEFTACQNKFLEKMDFYDPYTVNPFPNKPWFLRVCSKGLLKHFGKMRNCSLLAISHFPSVFYLSGELSATSSNLELSSADSFSLEESKICL